MEAEIRKFGKSRKAKCPYCSEWIEYAKTV
jgi:uncharacterized Zn-finger protein